MSILSDSIEEFIKTLMSEDKNVELQRNELAQYFRCAPSQINYVIKTRFNIERGYFTESRRGGGGYIRIIRVNMTKNDYLMNLVNNEIDEEISERDALIVIENLYQSGLVNKREAMIMAAAVRNTSIIVPGQIKDIVRANILRYMTIALIGATDKGDKNEDV